MRRGASGGFTLPSDHFMRIGKQTVHLCLLHSSSHISLICDQAQDPHFSLISKTRKLVSQTQYSDQTQNHGLTLPRSKTYNNHKIYFTYNGKNKQRKPTLK